VTNILRPDEGNAPVNSRGPIDNTDAPTTAPASAPRDPTSGEFDVDSAVAVANAARAEGEELADLFEPAPQSLDDGAENSAASSPLDLDGMLATPPDAPDTGTITAAHRQQLCDGSAIPYGSVMRAGIYSERDPKRVRDLLGESKLTRQIRDANCPALVFEYRIPGERGDEPVMRRVKLATPIGGVSYLSPNKSVPRLYLPPETRAEENRCWWSDVRSPLVICEGEKKTLAVAAQLSNAKAKSGAPYVVVGIAGITCWHPAKRPTQLLPDFHLFDLKDRTVTILFDSDADRKHSIDTQREQLAATLYRHGAKPRIARVPEILDAKKTGIDDYLVLRDEKKLGEPKRSLNFIVTAAVPWATPEKEKQATAAAGLCATEIELALAFIERLQLRARYIADDERWYVWNESVWVPDLDGLVSVFTRVWLELQLRKATESGDPDYMRLVKSRSTANGIAALLRIARADRRIAMLAKNFDADPNLLCVKNGVIDLRTGELGPHRPELLISKMIDVRYDRDATAPEWEKVLTHLFPLPEVRDYVGRAVGYSATGHVREDVFLVLEGPARSGKSTFLAGLKGALGPYYGAGRFESFCQHRANGPNQARSDLVQHVGRRLMAVSEVNPNRKFDQALMKMLTGGEGRGASFRSEYTPSSEKDLVFKPWFVCNTGDLPAARTEDQGWYERLRKIPLGGMIAEGGRDTRLRDRIEHDPAVRAGVLAWIVGWAVVWSRDGLGPPPAAVLDAGAELREANESPAAIWIRDAVALDAGAEIVKADLYSGYCKAAEAAGERPLTERAFVPILRAEAKRAGVALAEIKLTVNGKRANGWRGVRLVEAPAGTVLDETMLDDLFD
jgi:P4 family phage/plasmid primase-like protien